MSERTTFNYGFDMSTTNESNSITATASTSSSGNGNDRNNFTFSVNMSSRVSMNVNCRLNIQMNTSSTSTSTSTSTPDEEETVNNLQSDFSDTEAIETETECETEADTVLLTADNELENTVESGSVNVNEFNANFNIKRKRYNNNIGGCKRRYEYKTKFEFKSKISKLVPRRPLKHNPKITPRYCKSIYKKVDKVVADSDKFWEKISKRWRREDHEMDEMESRHNQRRYNDLVAFKKEQLEDELKYLEEKNKSEIESKRFHSQVEKFKEWIDNPFRPIIPPVSYNPYQK